MYKLYQNYVNTYKIILVVQKMADVKLSNIANVTENYDSIPTTLTSKAVITDMIAGLTIVKVADKQNWASGNLTYTITITNGAENAFENPTITDILDPALIKLVENSVITCQVQKV